MNNALFLKPHSVDNSYNSEVISLNKGLSEFVEHCVMMLEYSERMRGHLVSSQSNFPYMLKIFCVKWETIFKKINHEMVGPSVSEKIYTIIKYLDAVKNGAIAGDSSIVIKNFEHCVYESHNLLNEIKKFEFDEQPKVA